MNEEIQIEELKIGFSRLNDRVEKLELTVLRFKIISFIIFIGFCLKWGCALNWGR